MVDGDDGPACEATVCGGNPLDAWMECFTAREWQALGEDECPEGARPLCTCNVSASHPVQPSGPSVPALSCQWLEPPGSRIAPM